MSIRLYADVWDTFRGNADEKLSALAIADWANDDGRVLCTPIELASKARITHGTACEVLRKLVDCGFLAPISGAWYQIQLPAHPGGEAPR